MTNEDKDRLVRRMEIEISDTFIWDLVFKARDHQMDIDEASNEIFEFVMECIQTVLNEEVEETTNVETEEAIKILRETAWLECGNGEKTYKALNMGIKALEKQKAVELFIYDITHIVSSYSAFMGEMCLKAEDVYKTIDKYNLFCKEEVSE